MSICSAAMISAECCRGGDQLPRSVQALGTRRHNDDIEAAADEMILRLQHHSIVLAAPKHRDRGARPDQQFSALDIYHR